MTPSELFAHTNLALAHLQTIQLRDDFHNLLTDPESWLFIEQAAEIHRGSPFDLKSEE